MSTFRLFVSGLGLTVALLAIVATGIALLTVDLEITP